MELVGVTNQY